MRHLIERIEDAMDTDRSTAVVEADFRRPIPPTKQLVDAAKALSDATQKLDKLRTQMGGVRPMMRWEIGDSREYSVLGMRDYDKTDDGKKASKLFAAQAAVATAKNAFDEVFDGWMIN